MTTDWDAALSWPVKRDRADPEHTPLIPVPACARTGSGGNPELQTLSLLSWVPAFAGDERRMGQDERGHLSPSFPRRRGPSPYRARRGYWMPRMRGARQMRGMLSLGRPCPPMTKRAVIPPPRGARRDRRSRKGIWRGLRPPDRGGPRCARWRQHQQRASAGFGPPGQGGSPGPR